MSTYTILATGAMTESGLQTTLRNNNGSAKVFHALIKDAATEKEAAVYPCKDDYSISEDSLPFFCQLPAGKESVDELQDGNVLSDAMSNDN